MASSRIDWGLAGRVAMVTGGGARQEGHGIGSASAMMLARAGARVAVLDVDYKAGERTRVAIAEEGGVADTVQCDVSVPDACEQAVALVSERLGPPTVLINNVGVAGPPGTAIDVDLERWDRGMEVNLKSVMLMARAAIPAMVSAGSGAIVNMSSAAGLLGGHPALMYGTAKGAIVQMTRMMAAHHGLEGVRVNCVAPGMAYTPMVVSRGMSDEMRRVRRERSLLQTEGTAWDVAAAVLFLASDLARWVTGVTLPVDAGYSAGSHLPTPARR
ncbi:MAG TPA: SDR family oxidoreductase [Solirubrobacteraceae bacterium]|jgi:NAD(P)-dependent dehydrogenase (short-subunit alcohol dehydrogenase family)